MKKINKGKLSELIIIFILGFIPLLWFRGSEIIMGHDAGLALNPINHFIDRLYIWTERFGFGNDQVYALPGFFIHGLEALVSFLGFNLQTTQKLVFIFWFVLPGLSMYYFASKLEKELSLKFFALPASVFYMFNHFLLQGWFVAERTKFSLYIALPLVLSFLFDWEQRKKTTLLSATLISLTLFIFNGMGSFPLFGGLILSIFVFIFFYLIKSFSLLRMLSLIKLGFFTSLFLILLNAYWLLPFGKFLLTSYSKSIEDVGGASGVITWVNYISKDTSLINILRLQGIPEWYQNPLHPYANVFLSNPLLIAIAFLIPIMAFLPFSLFKDLKARKRILFFSFLALLSIIFVAGSHPPFGKFYVFLINYLPGFVAFRTPFYKFAPALWFSYAILIAFTISYLCKKIELKSKITCYSLLSIFCLTIVLYSYPFLNGQFFDYMKGKRTMRVEVPQYILDFGKWSESKERKDITTLALPAMNSYNRYESYTWGYWSPAPLTSLLTNASIINQTWYMSQDQLNILSKLYYMMRHNDKNWKILAQFLGIKSILLREDFVWDIEESETDNPDVFKKTLEDPDLKLVKKFGKWEVYDFKGDKNYKISTSSSLGYLVGEGVDIESLASLSLLSKDFPLYVDNYANSDEKSLKEDILKLATKFYIKPRCENCNLLRGDVNFSSYAPLIRIGSIFYPLEQIRKKIEVEDIEKKSLSGRLKYYSYDALEKGLDYSMFIDQNKETASEKNSQLQFSALSNFLNSIIKQNQVIEEYLKDKGIDNKLLIDVSDIVIGEKKIIYRYARQSDVPELLKLSYRSFILLTSIEKKIDKKLIVSLEEDKKKFLLNSPKDMEYDLAYKLNDNPMDLGKGINIKLDDVDYNLQPKTINSKWLYLGKFRLTRGSHSLEIKQPIVNLYSTPELLQIYSSKQGACYYSNAISGVEEGDVFNISFKARRTEGKKDFLVKLKKDNNIQEGLDLAGEILSPSSFFEDYTYKTVFAKDAIDRMTDKNKNNSFYLSICDNPEVDKNIAVTTMEIKDISIRKIAVPEVLFYNVNSDSNKVLNFNYNKKNQTEYNLTIDPDNKNPKVVQLRESYNDNWSISGFENNHFILNANFNGWIIDGENNKLDVYYKSQIFVKIGFLVSSISFLLITFLLFLKLKKYV